MPDDFAENFNKAVRDILLNLYESGGRDVINEFKSRIEQDMDRDVAEPKFHNEEWNGVYGKIDFRMRFKHQGELEIRVFTIEVIGMENKSLRLIGKSGLDPDLCFDVVKKRGELNDTVHKELVLCLMPKMFQKGNY